MQSTALVPQGKVLRKPVLCDRPSWRRHLELLELVGKQQSRIVQWTVAASGAKVTIERREVPPCMSALAHAGRTCAEFCSEKGMNGSGVMKLCSTHRGPQLASGTQKVGLGGMKL